MTPPQGGREARAELLALWGRMSAEDRGRLLEQARGLSRSRNGPITSDTRPRRGWGLVIVVAVVLSLFALWRADTVRDGVLAARDGIAAWSRDLLDLTRDEEAVTPPAPRKQQGW